MLHSEPGLEERCFASDVKAPISCSEGEATGVPCSISGRDVRRDGSGMPVMSPFRSRLKFGGVTEPESSICAHLFRVVADMPEAGV